MIIAKTPQYSFYQNQKYSRLVISFQQTRQYAGSFFLNLSLKVFYQQSSYTVHQSITSGVVYKVIFEDMQGQNDISARLRCIVMAGTATNKWKKLANRSKDRYYRLRELVTTEEDYRKDLISIKERIQQPLFESQIITENDVAKMFPNVESMIGLSVQLREELNAKFQNWDRRKTLIGQTMIRFSKFLLVYSDYFKNFNETQRKLKQILAENGGARLIQKKLSTENRVITFEDLISKPFQRPLKYHLILRDYASKVEKSHPDYQPLQEAIECYHRVNEQNNLSLENKEKDQMLMVLDNRFGGIIQAEARYFVKEYETTYIDNPFNMYILSDMVILAFKGTNNCLKIYLDKYSYVERPSNGHYFINRIYLFGRSLCVHLSFFDAAISDEVYQILKKLIEDTNKNEANREEMISLRTTRQSLVERRRSYTNLEPQFKRPMVVRVLGCEKRHLSPDKFTSHFIIEFMATPPKFDGPPAPRQVAYVTLETLVQIESLGKSFYKQEEFFNIFPILSRTKDMTEYEYKKNDSKRLQLQSLYITLFLNSIYRNPKILKRIDFVSYLLKLSEPMWLHLNAKQDCKCKACQTHVENYKSHKEYIQALKNRLVNYQRTDLNKKKFYCDVKTIQMQQLFAAIPAATIVKDEGNLAVRVAWVKSRLGWINHAYSYNKPQLRKLCIVVYLCNINGNESISVDVAASTRVRQILGFISRRLDYSLEDYALAATINNKVHILFDDEIIGDIVALPKEEGGFFNFFKSDDYPITLYLRKVWSLDYRMECQQSQKKLSMEVEEIIYRLRNEEIRLAMEESIAVYAFYYAYRHFIELDTLTLNKLKMKNQEFSRFVAPSLKNNLFFEKIYQIIERLKQDKSLLTSHMISERIIEFLSNKPGWNSYLFQALLLGGGGKEQDKEVKIGCDIRGIKVQEKNKVSLLYDFKFEESNWTCGINGFELIIRSENEYCFFGRDLWKVKYQLDFYRTYWECFIKKQ